MLVQACRFRAVADKGILPRGADWAAQLATKYACRSVCRGATRAGFWSRGAQLDSREVLQPIWLPAQIESTFDGVIHPRARFVWIARQRHACILQTLAAFAMIA